MHRSWTFTMYQVILTEVRKEWKIFHSSSKYTCLKMFHFQYLFYLFSATAIFIIASSVADEDKIEPVDLAYSCITVETHDENEDKSPILMLHGLGGSRKIWERLSLLLALRTKRTACAVDLRNHGDSPWNNRTDVETLAVDVGNFLDKKGIKNVNFIGQSLGGKAAMQYTLNNPDRVDSIITEDIGPSTIPQEVASQISASFYILKAALASVPEGTDEEGAKKFVIDFMNKKLEEVGSTEKLPDQIAEFLQIKLVDGKWRPAFNIDVFEEALKHPEIFLKQNTGLYEGPALFIYGTKSAIKVYEDKENILKQFPKAEFFPVEGAGHMVHGLYREFDDAVIRFLNREK